MKKEEHVDEDQEERDEKEVKGGNAGEKGR